MSKIKTSEDESGEYNPVDHATFSMPGVTPTTPQDKELAEQGIYQPYEQAANAPQVGGGVGVLASPDDKDMHADHAANLRELPPVPSERAGAASQAK